VSDADRGASLGMLAKVDATLVLCGHIPSPREYRDQCARSPQRRVPLRSYCDVSASMRVEPQVSS
jgi:hypothetical protein